MNFKDEIKILKAENNKLEAQLESNKNRLNELCERAHNSKDLGYRRYFILKGYSLVYTGVPNKEVEKLYFNCTFINAAGMVTQRGYYAEDLTARLEGAKELSKEDFLKLVAKRKQTILDRINGQYFRVLAFINSIPEENKEYLVSDLCGSKFCYKVFRTKKAREELLITKVKLSNSTPMFYVNSKQQWYSYEDLGESQFYADYIIKALDLDKFKQE